MGLQRLWGTSERMATVTKKDLIDRIADQSGETRVVSKKVVQQFLDEIVRELAKGNRLEFRDFGVFEVKERQARTAQNPRTLERVHVPAKKTIKFKPGRLMRDGVEKTVEDRIAEIKLVPESVHAE
ncbi:MAG: HU family DNA-binding protein [Planctomycetota bacterium]